MLMCIVHLNCWLISTVWCKATTLILWTLFFCVELPRRGNDLVKIYICIHIRLLHWYFIQIRNNQEQFPWYSASHVQPCPVIMVASSNGNIFCVTGPLCRDSPVTDEFPSQRPVTRSFDVLFDIRLNKRFGKQSRRRRFETPSRPLWSHCNDYNGPQYSRVKQNT